MAAQDLRRRYADVTQLYFSIGSDPKEAVGLLLKRTPKSQLVQNAAAACLLLAKTRFHHATPLPQELDPLSLVFQIQFKVLVITYKALYSPGPGYLKDCVRPPSPPTTIFCKSLTISGWGPSLRSHLLKNLGWWEVGRGPSLCRPPSVGTPSPQGPTCPRVHYSFGGFSKWYSSTGL